LLHANPGDRAQWEAVIPGLHGLGEVLAIDLPDHGLAADAASVDPDDTVAHVRDVVRELAPRPVIVAGTSFGAYIAARLLESPPEHVTGAVLASGFASLSEAQAVAYRQLADDLESGALALPEFSALATGLFLGPDEAPAGVRSGVEGWLRSLPLARLARGLRRSAACARPDRHVQRLARPATLLHGRADVAMPLVGAEALARLGPTRLEVLDTSSHLLPQTHPERCVRALRALLG